MFVIKETGEHQRHVIRSKTTSRTGNEFCLFENKIFLFFQSSWVSQLCSSKSLILAVLDETHQSCLFGFCLFQPEIWNLKKKKTFAIVSIVTDVSRGKREKKTWNYRLKYFCCCNHNNPAKKKNEERRRRNLLCDCSSDVSYRHQSLIPRRNLLRVFSLWCKDFVVVYRVDFLVISDSDYSHQLCWILLFPIIIIHHQGSFYFQIIFCVIIHIKSH